MESKVEPVLLRKSRRKKDAGRLCVRVVLIKLEMNNTRFFFFVFFVSGFWQEPDRTIMRRQASVREAGR